MGFGDFFSTSIWGSGGAVSFGLPKGSTPPTLPTGTPAGKQQTPSVSTWDVIGGLNNMAKDWYQLVRSNDLNEYQVQHGQYPTGVRDAHGNPVDGVIGSTGSIPGNLLVAGFIIFFALLLLRK